LIDEAEQQPQTPKNVAYLLLLATQIAGALVFVWQELPEFEQLLSNPGEQLPKDIHSDLVVVGVFCVMQIRSGVGCSICRYRFDTPTCSFITFFYFSVASVLFLAALYSLSLFSGIFLRWDKMPTSCKRPNVG
jgi:hypothetical protein